MQMYEHPGYRANATILYGTQQENTDLFPQQATLADNRSMVKTILGEGLACEAVIATSFGCPYEGPVDPERVLALAEEIRAAVREEFGIVLEMEPVVLG